MRTTNAARSMAPETPKPIDKEFIGPGGHPIAETKNQKVQGKKFASMVYFKVKIIQTTKGKQIEMHLHQIPFNT